MWQNTSAWYKWEHQSKQWNCKTVAFFYQFGFTVCINSTVEMEECDLRDFFYGRGAYFCFCFQSHTKEREGRIYLTSFQTWPQQNAFWNLFNGAAKLAWRVLRMDPVTGIIINICACSHALHSGSVALHYDRQGIVLPVPNLHQVKFLQIICLWKLTEKKIKNNKTNHCWVKMKQHIQPQGLFVAENVTRNTF